MAEGYLRPKQGSHSLGKRKMEEGIFKNPPEYTDLGGFSSSRKWTDPAGRRDKITGPGLERGGPTAQRGKPI